MPRSSEIQVEILPRHVVERQAHIVGPASAAAQALDCADRGVHGDDPVFVRPVGAQSILVTARTNLAPASSRKERRDA